MKTAALEFAARGWPVLPLHTPTKFGPKKGPDRALCSCNDEKGEPCESQGKHPRLKKGPGGTGGLHLATTTPATIGKWWDRWPDANIGIRTGIVFDALDLDTDSAADTLESHGFDVATLIGPSVTTGNGRHYYVSPTGIRNRTGILPGVDIRSDAGYVVAPPSLHYSGGRYQWVSGLGPGLAIPSCPELPELVATIKASKRPPRPAPARPAIHEGTMTSYARTSYANALDAVERAPEGGRNDQLNASAYTVGRLVHSGEIARSDAEADLLARASAAGLGEGEALATIRSGIDAGERDGPTPAHSDALDKSRRGLPATTRSEQAARDQAEVEEEHPADTVAELAEPGGLNLPDWFWAARPLLTHVRAAAWSRLLSPDAVLAALLARLAAATPPAFQIPALVGSPSSLAFYGALTGPAGTGKSTAFGAAAALLPIDEQHVAVHGLGSGEGLIELYMGDVDTGEKSKNGKAKTERQQIRTGALVTLDEGAALAELGNRKGSVMLPTLRSMWTGGDVGQSNASAANTRRLKAGRYSFGLIIGIQPALAADLLDDSAAGTPQRFIWARTTDPSIGLDPITWPGPLRWKPPQLPRGRPNSELEIAASVSAEVRSAALARLRGEVIADPLDAHSDLLRLKVAGLLAVLDGRLEVDEDDWNLARTIVETSTAVRNDVSNVLRWQAEEREVSADRRAARRAKVTAAATAEMENTEYERTLDSAARTARNIVAREDRVTRKAIHSAIGGRRRRIVTVDEVIDQALSLRWLKANDDGTYSAGPVSP